MILRKASLEGILNVVRAHSLTEHAFTLKIENTEVSLLSITYNLNSQFKFNVTLNTYGRRSYTIKRAPGPELLSETESTAADLDEIKSTLESWLNAIVAEDGIPDSIDTDIAKLKELFFKGLSERIKSEEQFFTKEEAADLVERLNNLEEQLANLVAEGKDKDAELKKLKAKINTAKSDIPNMTKRKWIFVGGGKILDAMLHIAKSREARKALVGGITGLLK